jgi:hypothetical protein
MTHLHRSLPGRQHVCRGSSVLDGGVRRCGDKRSLAASVKGRRLNYTCLSTPTTVDCIGTLYRCAPRNHRGGLLS